MLISRREVLKCLPVAFAGMIFPKAAFALTADSGAATTRKLVAGSDNLFCVIDINKRELLHAVNVGFRVHGFVQHPTQPERVWGIQRDVVPDTAPMYVVEFDITTGKEMQRITVPKGSQFRGHGFVAQDNSTLFVTRNDMSNGAAYLTGYDMKDGKPIADIHVGECGIHETILAKDGTVFVACSGINKTLSAEGKIVAKRVAKTSVAHYDLASGKRLTNKEAEDTDQYIGHFRLLPGGHIVAASNADKKSGNPGRIYIGRAGDPQLTRAPFIGVTPADKQSEMFGLAVNEKDGIVAISNYTEKVIYTFDIETLTVKEKVHFEQPWGIAFDKERDEFLVTGAVLGEFDHAVSLVRESPILHEGKPLPFYAGHSLLV